MIAAHPQKTSKNSKRSKQLEWKLLKDGDYPDLSSLSNGEALQHKDTNGKHVMFWSDIWNDEDVIIREDMHELQVVRQLVERMHRRLSPYN